MAEADIIARTAASALEIDAIAWNALLARQAEPTPFMRHEYLAALEASGSATAATGWTPRFMTLWQGATLVAACPLYVKPHSWGEYVFDWAWARAYEQHGLDYYPKAVVAVPFTPVPGSRLLATNAATRRLLMQALRQWCEAEGLSSLHILFAADEDMAACRDEGLMPRQTLQFHWKNMAPTLGANASSLPLVQERSPGSPERGALAALGRPGGSSTPFRDFDHFLSELTQDKRKKIRQERRRVADAGITFRLHQGVQITSAEWDFFYRCYERTYLEHGNPPYLRRAFFEAMARDMAGHWLICIASRGGQDVACSLVALGPGDAARPQVAYGRYWGALERVSGLHFEACYYQPLAWCMAQGVQHFEGGAQGEHKMARALMPTPTHSAHWLAHPAFADAVERFLAREGEGVEHYLGQLQAHSPFRQAPG